MIEQRPISISKNAFVFCRYFTASLIVAALLWKIEELIYLTFFILLSSAILSIKNAPLIFIYTKIQKLFKKQPKLEVVDIKAMRFAHSLGTLFSGACSILIFFEWSYAWGLVFLFAILKIVSASGFCPATKIYTCSTSGKCCQVVKKVKHKNDR